MRKSLALLILALVATPVAAFAETITFASTGSGAVTYTNASGSGTAVAYTGTVPYNLSAYPTALPGSTYITYNNSTEFLPAGLTTYSISVFSSYAATGTIQFVADDSVLVFLNGVQIGTNNSFSSIVSDPFTLHAGTNTFTFQVTNSVQPAGTANPTVLDFAGTAVTPEPSSLVLLGTGALGLAGAVRRRFVKA